MIRGSCSADGPVVGKPRASGDDPTMVNKTLKGDEVNPARAGMIRTGRSAPTPWASKPRASGDDPQPPKSKATKIA